MAVRGSRSQLSGQVSGCRASQACVTSPPSPRYRCTPREDGVATRNSPAFTPSRFARKNADLPSVIERPSLVAREMPGRGTAGDATQVEEMLELAEPLFLCIADSSLN